MNLVTISIIIATVIFVAYNAVAIAAMQGILSDPVLLEATLTNAKKLEGLGYWNLPNGYME